MITRRFIWGRKALADGHVAVVLYEFYDLKRGVIAARVLNLTTGKVYTIEKNYFERITDELEA